jgi:multidrug efflux pump subunit AcrA (membrane-fusion protein)
LHNYFNYFTEIEEHFQRRRGTLLLLSTLDWALIETWKEAGIPLEAALRGIDTAFDNYDRKPSKTRKVNSLAFCSQEVLAAAEEMKEAAVGTTRAKEEHDTGLSAAEISAYLTKNAALFRVAKLEGIAEQVARETADSLLHLSDELKTHAARRLHLEDIERRLTVLEEKLQAALLTATPEKELLAIRRDADGQIAAYRGKMNAAQIDQLQKQFLHKRLLERYGLPRLSLFYM